VILLPVDELLLWLLATRFGIVGAAIAWTTRSVIGSVVPCEFARAVRWQELRSFLGGGVAGAVR
jgi:hypothetical protein